jgi:hypothetical protein
MAINYEDVSQAIVDLLQDAIPTAAVLMEPAEVGSTTGPEIGVTLTGEENSETDIGSADPYQTTLRFSLLCSEYSVDGVLEAIKKRNVLVNSVRQAVKEDANRNLSGKADWTQLGRIEYETAQGETADFWAAANIELLVTLMA